MASRGRRVLLGLEWTQDFMAVPSENILYI